MGSILTPLMLSLSSIVVVIQPSSTRLVVFLIKLSVTLLLVMFGMPTFINF